MWVFDEDLFEYLLKSDVFFFNFFKFIFLCWWIVFIVNFLMKIMIVMMIKIKITLLSLYFLQIYSLLHININNNIKFPLLVSLLTSTVLQPLYLPPPTPTTSPILNTPQNISPYIPTQIITTQYIHRTSLEYLQNIPIIILIIY